METEEYRVVKASSQVNDDRNGPRLINSLLSENSGRPGASSEYGPGSEIPYAARSMPGGEVWSEPGAGSSEMDTDISLPVLTRCW